jgi:hypothetical protein
MASWKITLPNGSTHNQATISAGQYSTASELLDGAGWDAIEPTRGPRQLIAWIAILSASESDDKDVMTHLVNTMSMPMVDVVRMLQVSE